MLYICKIYTVYFGHLQWSYSFYVIMMFFSFNLLMRWITITDFLMSSIVKSPLHSWGKLWFFSSQLPHLPFLHRTFRYNLKQMSEWLSCKLPGKPQVIDNFYPWALHSSTLIYGRRWILGAKNKIPYLQRGKAMSNHPMV